MDLSPLTHNPLLFLFIKLIFLIDLEPGKIIFFFIVRS